MSSEATPVPEPASEPTPHDATRAITLWPEWVGAFALLDKRVENRTWRASSALIGTYIALHAGMKTGGGEGVVRRIDGLQSVARIAVRAGWRVHRDGTLRRVVDGVTRSVRLTDLDAHRGAVVAIGRLVACDDRDLTGWDVPGQFHWRFDDVHLLTPAAPMKGRQQVWVLQDDERAAIRAAELRRLTA